MSNTKNLYLAGDLMKKGARMLRMAEASQLESIGCYDVYNPMANKDINDKAVLPVAGLAEKIVAADTDRLFKSGIVVIEPQNDALGTITELGQLLGYKQLAEKILDYWYTLPKEEFIKAALELCDTQVTRKIYPHYEDIRFEGDTGNGYRSTKGVNAYVLGAAIELANDPIKAPDGFYSWNTIIEELTPTNSKQLQLG